MKARIIERINPTVDGSEAQYTIEYKSGLGGWVYLSGSLSDTLQEVEIKLNKFSTHLTEDTRRVVTEINI